jgi:hypothetical protein
MKLYLNSEASAQHWIDAGLATRTPKAHSADLRVMSFMTARAQALVHLTGPGAQMLDRLAKEQPPRP